MNTSIASSSMVVLLCFASVPALADSFLTGDQIAQLVKGKTVHAKHLKKGFTFTVYFDDNGKTAIRKQHGEATETTYRIEGDKHCIYWNGKDRCASLRDNGDGTYTRVDAGGKDVVAWNNFVVGKNL